MLQVFNETFIYVALIAHSWPRLEILIGFATVTTKPALPCISSLCRRTASIHVTWLEFQSVSLDRDFNCSQCMTVAWKCSFALICLLWYKEDETKSSQALESWMHKAVYVPSFRLSSLQTSSRFALSIRVAGWITKILSKVKLKI